MKYSRFSIRISDLAGHFHRVPPRSWAGLEQDTIAFTKYFAPECLLEPKPFPIDEVIQYRLNEIDDPFEVEFGVASLNQLGSEGAEGCVDWDPDRQMYQVLLSQKTWRDMLSGDGRARQSAAHEVAHYVEHREVVKQLRESELGMTGIPITAFFRRHTELKPYENAERQADVFASRLLLPAATVSMVAQDHRFNSQAAVSDTFQVTYSNATVRLKELGHPS